MKFLTVSLTHVYLVNFRLQLFSVTRTSISEKCLMFCQFEFFLLCYRAEGPQASSPPRSLLWRMVAHTISCNINLPSVVEPSHVCLSLYLCPLPFWVRSASPAGWQESSSSPTGIISCSWFFRLIFLIERYFCSFENFSSMHWILSLRSFPNRSTVLCNLWNRALS